MFSASPAHWGDALSLAHRLDQGVDLGLVDGTFVTAAVRFVAPCNARSMVCHAHDQGDRFRQLSRPGQSRNLVNVSPLVAAVHAPPPNANRLRNAGSKLVFRLNMHARAGPAVEFEQRPYGAESTHEEREAIADRVSVVADRILLIDELPVQSPFSVQLIFDRFRALSQDWERFAYVVDLTEARRPNPETRAALKAQIRGISPRVAHLAVVVGDNLMMRAMARLFAYGMGLTNVSTHATRAEAIEEARRAMGR
jgi:hypothetical protein